MKGMKISQGVKAVSLALLGLVGLNSCEKDNVKTTTTLSVYPVHLSNSGLVESYGQQVIEGATVYFYNTESDMLLKINSFATVVTENGQPAVISVPMTSELDTIYFSAEYNNLSSDRLNNYLFSSEEKTCDLYRDNFISHLAKDNWERNGATAFYMPSHVISIDYYGVIGLTPTATKLQLQVLNNLEPVTNAEVTLYYSESDYLNDIPAYDNHDEMLFAYGDYYDTAEHNKDCVKEVLSGTTDENGSIYFDQLEPKQYWFKVEKNGLTNASGTITTGKTLPDNSDITTSLTVGIN